MLKGASGTTWEFEGFKVMKDRRLLIAGGTPVPLTSKAFDTLVVLIENSDRIVTKDELLGSVWPDVEVEEGNLTQQIFLLRKALGDTAQRPRFIVTVPGHGYRFTARLNAPSEDFAAPPASSTGAAPRPAAHSIALDRDRPGAPIWRRPVAVVAAALLLVSVLAVMYWPSSTSSSPATISQISRWNRPIYDACLSPDGRVVAFGSPVNGVAQVFVMLTGGGEPLPLTHDVSTKRVDGFSPDGQEIYYNRDGEEWVVPTLGGPARRLGVGRSLVATPDGREYFYVKDGLTAVFKAGPGGSNEEQIYRFEWPSRYPYSILLFPGSTELLVATADRFYPPSGKARLVRLNLRDGTAGDLGLITTGSPSRLVWLDPGKTIVFSRTVNRLTNLWTYEIENRRLRQITTGAGADVSPMPDQNGRGIYYVNSKESSLLTAFHTRSGATAEIASDDASEPVLSPDGKRVIYLRFLESREQHTELWVSNTDGSNKARLASGPGLGTGNWSPDGSQVSYYETSGPSSSRVYLVGADGRNLREIRGLQGFGTSIAWSADGETTYASMRVGDFDSIWKASADGTGSDRVLDRGCLLGDNADRTAKYLPCFVIFGPDIGIYEVALADNRRVPLLKGIATFGAKFTPDGKAFVYPVAGRDEIVFYRQGWQDGQLVGTSQVALRLPFAFPFVYKGIAFDFAPDLSTIVYARPVGQADLYFMPVDRSH
jgi:DNA-binding winged helix-turn-helix (wHTH) protein/Tol biopolymer transport system component